MDKSKVIEAYRLGLINLQECGQILGTETSQLENLVMQKRLYYREQADRLITIDHL